MTTSDLDPDALLTATKALYEKYETFPQYALAQMNTSLAEILASTAIIAYLTAREPGVTETEK